MNKPGAKSKMGIATRKLSALIPYARNSRTHDRAQIDLIVHSLEKFGWTNPILISPDNTLIAGHGRLLAAEMIMRRGLSIRNWPDNSIAPVIEIAHLSEDERKAYVIADNRLAELSQWDEMLLSAEIADIADADFDIDILGFDADYLSKLTEEFGIERDSKEQGENDKDVFVKYGGATAMARGSVPMRFWRKNGYLKGNILDFGCGKEDHKFAKYDAFTQPNTDLLLRRWDTITCNYVLNVHPAEHLIIQTCALIYQMLKPDGHALVAVRNDISHSYDGPRGRQIAKSKSDWADLLREVFWAEPIETSKFFGFICSRAGDPDET